MGAKLVKVLELKGQSEINPFGERKGERENFCPYMSSRLLYNWTKSSIPPRSLSHHLL